MPAVTFAANYIIVCASFDFTVRAIYIRRYRNFSSMVGPPTRRQFSCSEVEASGDFVAEGCVDTFEVIVWSFRTGQVLEVLTGSTGTVSRQTFRP